MTRKFQIVALAVALVLSAAAVVSAQEGGEKITIKRDTRLGSEVLPKGEYTLHFTAGDKGELVFVQGKREVLKATYTVAKLEGKASNTVVVSTMAGDGSYQLKRIEF